MVESGTYFCQGFYNVISVLLLLGVIVTIQIIASVNYLLQRTWFYMYYDLDLLGKGGYVCGSFGLFHWFVLFVCL